MSETIVHEISPVWDEESRVLILGTLPSPKSRENGFFYMHPQNRFWEVIFTVFGEKLNFPNKALKKTSASERLEAINERRDFLIRHKIALWDVLKQCDISGASDASIKNAVPNDFTEILSRSKIRHIFCTGKTAFALWKKHCSSVYEERFALKAACLPSTSPANAAWSVENLVAEYSKINNLGQDFSFTSQSDFSSGQS